MWNYGILHKWIAPGDPLGRWPKVPPPAVASNVATPVVFDSLHGHQLPSLPRFLGNSDQISADDISWMMSFRSFCQAEVPQSWDTLRTHCIFHNPFDCFSLFVFWKVFTWFSHFHSIHHPNHHSTESMTQDPLHPKCSIILSPTKTEPKNFYPP